MTLNKLVIASILVITTRVVIGQVDSTSTGEIVDAEILIEKEQKISFPVREKIDLGSQMQSFDPDPLKLRYESIEPNFDWPPYKSDVKYEEQEEKVEKPFGQSFIRAGYGNFSSPLFELGVFQYYNDLKLNLSGFYESFAKGPIADEASASANGNVNVGIVYQKENFSIEPSIGFKGSRFNYYGDTRLITPELVADSVIEGNMNNFTFDILAKGSTEKLSYSIKPYFSNTIHKLTTGEELNKESGFGLLGDFSFKLDNAFEAGLDLEGYGSNFTSEVEYGRSLFNLSPWLKHSIKNLELKAGFTISSGSIEEISTQTGFYPYLGADWEFTSNWTLFASLKGGMKWNGLNEILLQNQYLDDSLTLLNTNVTSSFGGGIKGTPIKNLYLRLETRLDNIEDLPLFVPSGKDSTRFSITYDERTINLFKFSGELSYLLSANTTIGTQLSLFGYSTKTEEKAWHLPSYLFNIYTSHAIKEKVLITTELISEGGINAPIVEFPEYLKINSFIDLNLHISYLITKQASAFVQVNNLTGSEYKKYIGYPVRGLIFKIGGKYRF